MGHPEVTWLEQLAMDAAAAFRRAQTSPVWDEELSYARGRAEEIVERLRAAGIESPRS